MNTLILLVLAVAIFLVGVLVGRANPKKADRLAEIAEDIKNKTKKAVDGR